MSFLRSFVRFSFAVLLVALPLAALTAEEMLVASGKGTPRVVGLATMPVTAVEEMPSEQVALAETAPAPDVSEAEKITGLQKTIAADEKKVAELKSDMSSPRNEYQQAEAAFKSLDKELIEKQDELEKLNVAGKMQEAEAALITVMDLEKKRGFAQERFDLAIQTRKTEQEQLAALEEKLIRDKAALEKLAGPAPVAAPPSATPVKTALQELLGTAPPAAVAPVMPASATPVAAPPAAAAPAQPAPVPTSTQPAPAAVATPAAAPVTPAPAAEPAVEATDKPASKELVEAEQQAQIKKEEAEEAERDAESVVERIQSLDKDIELETKLLIGTRKKADIAYQSFQNLSEESDKLATEGAPQDQQRDVRRERRQAEDLFKKASTEVTERTERLNELQSRRSKLQQEELAALSEAKQKHEAAQAADDQVRTLKNPLSLVNLLQWLIDHGPKIATLLIAMLIGRIMVGLTSRRMVSLMAHRGDRGTQQEREDRARTLAGVFHNAASTTILVGGVLMLFEEVGIAVAPLMGGAAVLGLAVAFGAQNLLRDYFYGFVILLENQYKLNDILQIGPTVGQVEQITLRMTVLRDQEGNVHFIPNGKIDSVTNMTHGWARVVVDINVPDSVDLDDTMRTLMETAGDLRVEPDFQEAILGDPEMLGVESLSDTSVVLRLTLKTRATHKQQIRRELLQRIRRRLHVREAPRLDPRPKAAEEQVTIQEPLTDLGAAA
jgi:small-conductance mechanosensitive channel